MKELNDDVKNLISRALNEDMSPEESERFAQWLNSSDENKEIYEEYKYVWKLTDIHDNPEKADIDEQWKELESRLDLKKIAAQSGEKTGDADQANIKEMKPPAKAGSKPKRKWITLAVAVLAVAAVGVFGVMLFDYLKKPKLIEVITAADEVKEVMLDDGSKVLVNGDSRIQYNDYFPENSIRFVHVWGEAFFDVIKEPRSFIVVTENATVKAFGTSFSVRYRDEVTRVIVKTGSVGFKAKMLPASAGAILLKGEMLTYKDESELNPATIVDTDQYLEWVERKIVFDETSLSDVIKDLKNQFDVEIEFADADLGTETITGSFHQQPVEDIISSICLTLNISYNVEDGKYIISR